MRQIKIILISLYIIILGFIVFGNTSVFGADAESVYITPVEETTNFTDYFINMQDRFDYSLLTSNRQGFVQAKNFLQDAVVNRNYGYFVEAVLNTGYGSGNESRGYIVNVFFISQTENLLTLDKHFNYITFTDYQLNSQVDFYYPCCQVQSWYKFVVYNYGNNYQLVNNGSYENCLLPFCCLNYTHPIFLDSIISNTSNGQIANAINNQTNSIVNETQKQTNEITGTVTNSTREQTNALLDTNDTGNETMSVNDTTTDTSADLGGLFNSINSAFTDTTSETQKGFDLKLPNGDTHTFTLKANVLTSFLDNNPVLKAFYQAFFYVVFGGYVIFDFKKIINKLKEGNIDNVVGSSSPVDSVVNMSLK